MAPKKAERYGGPSLALDIVQQVDTKATQKLQWLHQQESTAPIQEEVVTLGGLVFPAAEEEAVQRAARLVDSAAGTLEAFHDNAEQFLQTLEVKMQGRFLA